MGGLFSLCPAMTQSTIHIGRSGIRTPWSLQFCLIAAVCVPYLLVFNLQPSSTVFNQAASLAGWGLVLAALPTATGRLSITKAAMPAMLLMGTMALGSLGSAWLMRVPLDYALGTDGMMLAGIGVMLAGMYARQHALTRSVLNGLSLAWYLGALGNVIVAGIQVFAPQFTDGVWLAQSALHGRGIGNLRQPNLMALLLLWAMLSVLWWLESAQIGRKLALMLLLPLVFGVALTASRAGTLGLFALAIWDLARARRDGTFSKTFLGHSLWMLLCSWMLLYGLAQLTDTAFATADRAAEGVASPGRIAILRDAWELLRHQPMLGVGWGGLNFAWALSPNPHRANYNFDHTHNLVAQWFVELGIPLGLLLTGLGIWTVVTCLRQLATAKDQMDRAALRLCVAALLLIAAHNQLEFPFWYAYFLLPSAFCLGICLASKADPVEDGSPVVRPGRSPGLLLILGAALIVMDFMRVAAIFSIFYEDEPIEQRLARGQRSLLYSSAANYLAAVARKADQETLLVAPRAAHGMADPGLLIRWSQAFERDGQHDKAIYLAARAREFKRREDTSFFAVCDDPQLAGSAYQCQTYNGPLNYRDFKR